MNPPLAVRVTSILMFLSILVGLVVLFTQPPPPMPSNVSAGMAAGLSGAIKIVAIVIALVEAVIVFFYMKGASWAKWCVVVASIWYILQMLFIAKAMRTSHISAGLVAANAILAVYLLVYLFSKEAKAYFSPGSAMPPQQV